MFNERKVAQMAAFLLKKRGGTMSHLKLMKLLYMADRTAMGNFGNPISGDYFFSLKEGPVLSCTLNLMAGIAESVENGWETWISDKANHEVSLRRHDFQFEDLDQLSQADVEILDKVWAMFGHMTRWQIRDYTHDNCAEWENPNGSSRPIPIARIFQALGRSDQEAAALTANIEAERDIDRLFAAL